MSHPPTPPPTPTTVPPHGDDHGPRERLLDLLVARATEGLSRTDEAEMNRLLEQHPDVDPQGVEYAAAGAMLAAMDAEGAPTALPANLRERLLASWPVGGRSIAGRVDGAVRVETALPSRSVGIRRLALAACLGLVAGVGLSIVAGWLGSGSSGPSMAAATLGAMEAFVRERADTVKLTLKGAAAGAEGASGELVWSDAAQAGYFRVTNLAPSQAGVSQYQMWIVDPARDAKPVDGGVFDIGPGENVVRIEAKLRVDKPAVFAITKEKVGGVVVSAGPLLVVAAR